MPVTGLYFLPEPPSGPPTLSSLLDRLQTTYTALPSTRYVFEHRLLRSTIPSPPPAAPTSATSPPIDPTTTSSSSSNPEFLQLLEIPHLSPRCPLLTIGNTVTAVDRDFAKFLTAKLGGMWTHRQTLRCEGQAFEIEGGDVRVRVGRLLMGEAVRGSVVEVEVVGVGRMEDGGEVVVREFVEGLLEGKGGGTEGGGGERGKTLGGPGVGQGRWVLGKEKGEEWGMLDTGRQYCELLRFR